MAAKKQESAEQSGIVKDEITKTAEVTEPKEVLNPPRMSPELVENIIEGNFDHIRKHFGIGAWKKAKTKENRVAMLERLKKLTDSMHYLYEGWGDE